MERLFFLGDIHANLICIKNHISVTGIRNAKIFQVGDFGVGFITNELEQLDDLNSYCSTVSVHIYIIRGNHDNPKIFRDAMYCFSNLHFLRDYDVVSHNSKNILCIGGGVSIDRKVRIKGSSYWPDEVFQFDQKKLEGAVKNLNTVDIVVTHSAPVECYPFELHEIVFPFMVRDAHLSSDIKSDRSNHSKVLRYLIEKKKKPKYWFYGHFHDSHTMGYSELEFVLLDIEENKELLF